MKKFLIVIILIASCNDIFAHLVQGNWRWRNDDGDETTATWKDAENTSMPFASVAGILRLRYELHTAEGPLTTEISVQLQYATDIEGTWTTIESTAGSNAFVMANTSAFVAQDNPTTKQVSSEPFTFLAGKIMVSANTAALPDMTQEQNTEMEWAIKGTPNTLSNTTYYFRNFGSGTTYDSYPSLTTAPIVLPVRLTSFTLIREGKKIRIEWATASEQGNERFEILHSSNGNIWKTIENIKGQGSATTFSTYKTYDESPLSGINYYKVKQYDVNGHSSLSDVKFVKMPASKSIVSVYPNPTRSVIGFSIAGNGASNVQAALINVNGAIIHQEIFKGVPANTINKLSMGHKPAPGVYILKLKTGNVTESVRVIIE